MSKEQKMLLMKEIEKELYRRSLFEFVKFAATLLEPSTDWDWNFHHEYLCDVLQSQTLRMRDKKKRDKHIIINVPFRSSKSLIVSICYPIWSWLVHPHMSFINLSYSDNLSTDHSNKVVAIINHPKFKALFDWQFDENQRAKTDFKLKHGGKRLSGGVGGTVLGRGADCIILDDPNSTKKLSEVERHNAIKAWTDTINTRLNAPTLGLFIVIQQRLHQGDLSGYLLENDPQSWQHICLPAEINDKVSPPYLSDKYVDNLLWPSRFSVDVLRQYKKTLGSAMYANQLQQDTVPEEGLTIKRDWINVISYDEFLMKTYGEVNQVTGHIRRHIPKWDLFLDTAYTKKQENDPSAISVVTYFQGSLYVRKVFEVWLEFPELIKKIKEVIATHCTEQSRIFIEPKASGLDVLNTLRRSGFNVVEIKDAKGDKESRLSAVAPYIEGSRLYLIDDASNEIVISQLTGFPRVKHDDVMDTIVYALLKYLNKSSGELNYLML